MNPRDLDLLAESLTATGFFAEVGVGEDDVVQASAPLAAGPVAVFVDPDPEDEGAVEVDLAALAARAATLQALDGETLADLKNLIAEEITAAMGEVEGAEVLGQGASAVLRDDLYLASAVVVPGTTLLIFVAHTQLPEALIRVQVSATFEVEDLELVLVGDDWDEDDEEFDGDDEDLPDRGQLLHDLKPE